MCWFSQRYLVAAEQHLSPEQLFFHSTTTYWVTQSAQPSLAIPLGVPGAHAKSLQLSLPYLLLMSALRYTNPCHYQSRLPHTFKPELFFVFSATPRFFFYFASNVLLEVCRRRKVTWQLLDSVGRLLKLAFTAHKLSPRQPDTFPADGPYNVFLEAETWEGKGSE